MDLILTFYRFLFARTIFQRFNYLIFRCGLSGLGILNYKNEFESGEFYLIKFLLPQIIKNNKPLLIDIGANVGNYTIRLMESFPFSTIYCFEPHPKNFDQLQININSKNVIARNIGLGETEGRVLLFDREAKTGSEHASLYKNVISDIHKQKSIHYQIEIETLDRLSTKEGWKYIDYLKIDTEGHELSILKGAKNLLEQKKIGIIHFEFNEMNIVSRVFFRDFRLLLENYQLYRLLPNQLLKLNDNILLTEIFAFQNIVAIPCATL